MLRAASVKLCADGFPGQLEMPVEDDGMCQVCEKVMGYVNTAMQNPNTEKNIERVLDVMCLQLALIYKPLVTVFLLAFIE